MSRLTATQVIDQGNYLEDDFDANTLTMPHLLSILTFHSFKYPVPYNKSKLVQAFNEQIKPCAADLRKERLERNGSIASSHGITDGLTGRSMSEEDDPVPEKPVLRRSSRRLSRPPSLAPEDPQPNKPIPPKRRRSSAGPSLSKAPSAKAVEPQQPTLLEESEPEEAPAKKVGRPRKSVLAAGVQARRVIPPEEGEGWSDNNVFQSGAESSSPVRMSPNVKAAATRRPARRHRTSLSAPPQMPSSSPFAAPSSATFQPRLSVSPREDDFRPFIKEEPRSSSPIPEETHDGDEADSSREAGTKPSPESLTEEVSRALAYGGSQRALRGQHSQAKPGLPRWARVVTVILAIVAGLVINSYKEKSMQLGYCTAGTNTNAMVEEAKKKRLVAEECARQLDSHNEPEGTTDAACETLPSLFSFFEPTACTACPAHAYCTVDEVICEDSYKLQKHPLAEVPFIPSLFNGLPGFGPVAFPMRCVEDEKRRKTIGQLGRLLEHYLANIRGQKLCLGSNAAATDAARWGQALDLTHDQVRKLTVEKKRVIKPEEYEGLFEQAVAELQHGNHIIMDDSSGTQYIAAIRYDLDLPCKIRVVIRNTWNEWKYHVLVIALLFGTTLWTRNKIASYNRETRRVSNLVQVALDTLRNQELQHHTDPVTYPHAYLSSIHLRDLVLQDEHSIPARTRLWNKVERIVEGNTNVRASVEELAGGDEGRVWRWVGGARSAIRSS